MKTDGHYWLQFLSEEERPLFIDNIDTLPPDEYLNDIYDSFYKFIAGAFYWLDSKQCHIFWIKIANKKLE